MRTPLLFLFALASCSSSSTSPGTATGDASTPSKGCLSPPSDISSATGTEDLTLSSESGTNLCAASHVSLGGSFGGSWAQAHNPPDGTGVYSVQFTGNCLIVTIGGANTKPVTGQSSTVVAPASLGAPLSQGQASVTLTDTCTQPSPQQWSATGGAVQIASVADPTHVPAGGGFYAIRWNLSNLTMAPLPGSIMAGKGTFQLDGYLQVDPYGVGQ